MVEVVVGDETLVCISQGDFEEGVGVLQTPDAAVVVVVVALVESD